MAMNLSEMHNQQLAHLRIQPTAKRVRALLDNQTVLDSRRALLVWEPNRIVPTYAVPREDVDGTISERTADPDSADPDNTNPDSVDPSDVHPSDVHPVSVESAPDTVWDPRVPFSVRTTPGRTVAIGDEPSGLTVDGFVADDPDLEGYVIVDFAGFTRWLEDEDEIVSHPHDPYARIDIRQSAQHLEFALDGVAIADTHRAKALYETHLPVRYYLPPQDVLVAMKPSSTVTVCAYKGRAIYYSPVAAGKVLTDFAWSYGDPLVDALEVRDYIAFFDEKLDVTIDGVPRPRPVTPWS
jgi:uncharacterized protein (DUF427 family)